MWVKVHFFIVEFFRRFWQVPLECLGSSDGVTRTVLYYWSRSHAEDFQKWKKLNAHMVKCLITLFFTICSSSHIEIGYIGPFLNCFRAEAYIARGAPKGISAIAMQQLLPGAEAY